MSKEIKTRIGNIVCIIIFALACLVILVQQLTPGKSIIEIGKVQKIEPLTEQEIAYIGVVIDEEEAWLFGVFSESIGPRYLWTPEEVEAYAKLSAHTSELAAYKARKRLGR